VAVVGHAYYKLLMAQAKTADISREWVKVFYLHDPPFGMLNPGQQREMIDSSRIQLRMHLSSAEGTKDEDRGLARYWLADADEIIARVYNNPDVLYAITNKNTKGINIFEDYAANMYDDTIFYIRLYEGISGEYRTDLEERRYAVVAQLAARPLTRQLARFNLERVRHTEIDFTRLTAAFLLAGGAAVRERDYYTLVRISGQFMAVAVRRRRWLAAFRAGATLAGLVPKEPMVFLLAIVEQKSRLRLKKGDRGHKTNGGNSLDLTSENALMFQVHLEQLFGIGVRGG
jgi:hypothetical protein